MSLLLGARPDELRAAFYRLTTVEDVAALLEVSKSNLTYHAFRAPKGTRYRTFAIPKRSGGVREIRAPATALRILQRKLNQVFQAVYQPKVGTHGFVAGRGIATNAKPHLRQRWVFNVDIKDFFPSINFGRIQGLLMATPYNRPKEVATVLAALCSDEGVLPQGAPSSPVISNMICASMDTQLRRLAQNNKCTYTRYADDITFSTSVPEFPRRIGLVRVTSDGIVSRVGRDLHAIIKRNGFSINETKVRLRSRLERQEVTGLTTNRKLNVQRRYVRQVRAMLNDWRRTSHDAAGERFLKEFDARHRSPTTSPPEFRQIVYGKLDYLGGIKGRTDRVYSNLVIRARELDKIFFRLKVVYDAVWVLASPTTFEQGTGFMIKGIGLVTCNHVLAPDTVAFTSHNSNETYSIAIKAPKQASRRGDLGDLRSETLRVEDGRPTPRKGR